MNYMSCGNCYFRHPEDRDSEKPVRCAHFNKVFPIWKYNCLGWIEPAITEEVLIFPSLERDDD
jgi:hypothetical protein